MNSNEKKLYDNVDNYIDKLNAEQKPDKSELSENQHQLEKLYETARLVKSLKDPAMPEADFPKKLADSVENKPTPQKFNKQRKKFWFMGTAAAAIILVMAIVMNFISPLSNSNIVYAMEQAFREVKAYHGIIDVVVSNAEGENTTQSKLEIWADKAGHYYVKKQEGMQKDLITVNNGQKKWQLHPDDKQVIVFSAFPDPYRFVFELGNEIEDAKNALSVNTVGEDTVAGRPSTILEVTPQGGIPYRIWVDKETNLPLQKQSGMQNALRSTITYAEIDFSDILPEDLFVYNVPEGFVEIDKASEQLVNNIEEAGNSVGFTPTAPTSLADGYAQDYIAIVSAEKIVKQYYTGQKGSKVVLVQGKAQEELNPASTAILGKVAGNIAEIQSPIQESLGILGGGGVYAGVTDTISIRWQQDGFEYAVFGNTAPEELILFVEGIAGGKVEIPSTVESPSPKPQVEVPIDLQIVENEQKSSDAGHSPWKLDPAFVAQVFVSLQISPEGITGEYPIKYEDLEISINNGADAIIEVKADQSPIKRVYLKRLIRQDSTGIWTVVGYDKI